MSWTAGFRERCQSFEATEGFREAVSGIQEAKKCPELTVNVKLLAGNISNCFNKVCSKKVKVSAFGSFKRKLLLKESSIDETERIKYEVELRNRNRNVQL